MALVLVIDDNPSSLELMGYLLNAFGHQVLRAIDGAQGESLVRENLPDIIVSDIQLPNVDGFELARRLKQDSRLSMIPLVAITALAMVGDREKILEAGFDGYIAKPIVPESFVHQIEAVLKNHR